MKKFYAVMLFYAPYELGIDTTDVDFILHRIISTIDPTVAMNVYANTPCPASQLIEADSQEDLLAKVEEMKANYNDKDWLEENVYPYL